MRTARHRVIALTVVMAACGGGGAAIDGPTEPPIGGGSGVGVFANLALTPDHAAVPVGGTLQLAAMATDASGGAVNGLPDPAWETGDAGLAVVSATGLVRGVSAGTVAIRAILVAGGVTDTSTATITIFESTPPPPPTASNVSVQAFRSGYTPALTTLPIGGTVTWTMVDDDHTVSFDGPAPPGGSAPRTEEGSQVSRTFTAAGTYHYHCDRHDEMRGVIEVEEQATGNPVFTSLTLSPGSASVQVGSVLQLTATARDQYGAVMSGLGAPQFATSDPSIATVAGTGAVTGIAAGTASITASLTSGGVSRTASAEVSVSTTAPPPTGEAAATVATVGESFSPSAVTITAGGTVTWTISGATHNVTFSGATPTGGNIPDTRSGSYTRTFPTLGTFNYQCTRHSGMTGQVIVR